ncbi:PH domain-containing protein [Petrachloros mirabilis]
MMANLHLVEKEKHEQSPVWAAFPSWAQFSWLFLLSAVSATRAALFFRFGVSGWEMWLVGAAVLIVCAAMVRRWAHYELTRDQLTIRNGYTGREIQSMALSDVREVKVRQGLVADFFGIGTLVVYSQATDAILSLRGVYDPEEVKIRIEALAWRSNHMVTSSYHPSA